MLDVWVCLFHSEVLEWVVGDVGVGESEDFKKNQEGDAMNRVCTSLKIMNYFVCFLSSTSTVANSSAL